MSTVARGSYAPVVRDPEAKPERGRAEGSMTDRARLQRHIRSWALAASLVGASACRTGVEDVHRWATTAQGPGKIVAVMTHDKYPDPLRVEAAMTLVRMKPR